MKAAVTAVTRIPIKYWVVFLTLFILNIYVAVSSATYGAQLITIEKQMKEISEENKKVMEQMVSNQSLQNISRNAEEIGLMHPKDILYLDAPSSLTAAF